MSSLRYFFAFCIITVVGGANQAAAMDAIGILTRQPIEIHQLDSHIFFGAAPKRREDYERLAKLGVTRILDVRSFKRVSAWKECHQAKAVGIEYSRLPSGYRPTQTGNLPAIMKEIYKPSAGAIYFHCNLGSDRTGLLAAIYRTERLGWDAEAALAHWKSDQFNPLLKDLDRAFWRRVGGQHLGK